MSSGEERPIDDGGGKVPDDTPVLREVSWLSQLYWAIWKNNKLFLRRPIMLLVMIFSTVVSVVLSWLAGKDPEPEDVIYAPLSDCGTADVLWIESIDYEGT